VKNEYLKQLTGIVSEKMPYLSIPQVVELLPRSGNQKSKVLSFKALNDREWVVYSHASNSLFLLRNREVILVWWVSKLAAMEIRATPTNNPTTHLRKG
jgi:hypothetical protein